MDVKVEKGSIDSNKSNINLLLQPEDNERLANLCGPLHEHIKQIEDGLKISINHRGNEFYLSGDSDQLAVAQKVLNSLYASTGEHLIDKHRVHLLLQEASGEEFMLRNKSIDELSEIVRARRVEIRPRSRNQKDYIERIRRYDVNFGIGPAGTGKTYLAVACAVEALEEQSVRRVVLVRPAVEAGERLGFLPGDLAQKVDPYLRPLYDALYEMLGFERVGKYIERNVIEIAPLAYMRGRTLNDAFVILDEAQNTSVEQMKMFLTRLGFGSKAVVTGDITQIDLPKEKYSGLQHVIKVLGNINQLSFTHFDSKDVVRHPLVKKILDAYHRHEQNQSTHSNSGRNKPNLSDH